MLPEAAKRTFDALRLGIVRLGYAPDVADGVYKVLHLSGLRASLIPTPFVGARHALSLLVLSIEAGDIFFRTRPDKV
jgi:hypothetical protein